MANTGGVINDLFDVEESGYATAMFAFASVAGPPLGNVISGFLAEAAGWRWLFWFYVSGGVFLLCRCDSVEWVADRNLGSSRAVDRSGSPLRDYYRWDS